MNRTVVYGINEGCGHNLDNLFLDASEKLLEPLGCTAITEYRRKDCEVGYCMKRDIFGGKRAILKRRDKALVFVLPDNWSRKDLSEKICVNEKYIRLLGRSR